MWESVKQNVIAELELILKQPDSQLREKIEIMIQQLKANHRRFIAFPEVDIGDKNTILAGFGLHSYDVDA